jgi:hypothetical protein
MDGFMVKADGIGVGEFVCYSGGEIKLMCGEYSPITSV